MASLTHELLSRNILVPLSEARQVLRASRRGYVLAYRQGMRFRRNALEWDVDRRRAWMLKRLRFVLRRAALDTEYYRDVFERAGFDPWHEFGFEDLAWLPVLERDDLAHASTTMLSSSVPAEQLVKRSTGGSTGAPTEVWLGHVERGWADSGVAFPLRRVGAPPGASVGLLWGHHLDPVERQTLRQRYQDFEANVRWFDCFRVSPELLDRYHHAFQRWRPVCIIAYASGLAALSEHVLEQGYETRYPTRCFVTGAEKLLRSQRERIEQAFGRPVHERYGSRDAGPIAFQLDPRRTLDFEVDWANVLIEPETFDGTSPILVTKLHADGMPMIRYRIGDLGHFASDASPGHPTFVLHEVVGREIDRIFLPDGRWVSGAEIPHLMKDHPVREFMFLQRADYSIELQLVPRAGFGDDSRREILRTVTDNLPGVPVELVVVDAVRRVHSSKLRPVVSEVRRLEREVKT